MNVNHFGTPRQRRAGLSALEFIGCFFALVGGACLGAMYLGIDLRHVAYSALSQSDLLDKMPENWRPAPPEGKAAPTQAELAHAVQSELASLREEVTALRTAHESKPADGSQSAAPSSAAEKEALAKQQTVAYWNRIHEILREQAALQQAAESTATENNAVKLAALKARINRFAASALRAVPTKDVDHAAVALSDELAAWYERGGEHFDQAVRLWESSASGPGGEATKEWESAQLQLRNEGRLLGDKVAAIRDSLSRRFNAEFKEITGP